MFKIRHVGFAFCRFCAHDSKKVLIKTGTVEYLDAAATPHTSQVGGTELFFSMKLLRLFIEWMEFVVLIQFIFFWDAFIIFHFPQNIWFFSKVLRRFSKKVPKERLVVLLRDCIFRSSLFSVPHVLRPSKVSLGSFLRFKQSL